MTQPNIVFLDEYSLGDADLSQIKALGNYTAYRTTRPEEIVSRCTDADIVITNKVPFTAETLHQLPRLKLICIAATGMNHIDLKTAAEQGVKVRNAIGYSTHSVTETTLGGALSLYRQIPYYDRFTKEEYPKQDLQFNFSRPTRTLHGKNWGIIGLGNIGREVAKVATAMGCTVKYTSTSGIVREEAYPEVTLSELLSWADIISIHCPLTPHTHNLIDSPELALMRPHAILINVARGGIVNEKALAEALNRDLILGAALDVFSDEPFNEENPLLHVKDPSKLILSPHNAWSAEEAMETLVKCIRDNIRENYEAE